MQKQITDDELRALVKIVDPSPRQLEMVELRLSGLSMLEVAQEMGINERSVYGYLEALVRKAAKVDGVADAAPGGVVPAGFVIKGKSHMKRDADGNPVWVKTEQDKVAQLQAFVDAIENASDGIKPIKPLPAPKRSKASLLTLYHFTDYHLGMYAWAAETGEDWDTNIAKRTFATSLAEMLENTPDSEWGVFSQGGDFCHWDGWDQVTPMSKHLLDADTRFPLMAETALDMHIHAIEELLKKHKKVKVIIQEGNHDMASSVWIRKAAKKYFPRTSGWRLTIQKPRITATSMEIS